MSSDYHNLSVSIKSMMDDVLKLRVKLHKTKHDIHHLYYNNEINHLTRYILIDFINTYSLYCEKEYRIENESICIGHNTITDITQDMINDTCKQICLSGLLVTSVSSYIYSCGSVTLITVSIEQPEKQSEE